MFSLEESVPINSFLSQNSNNDTFPPNYKIRRQQKPTIEKPKQISAPISHGHRGRRSGASFVRYRSCGGNDVSSSSSSPLDPSSVPTSDGSAAPFAVARKQQPEIRFPPAGKPGFAERMRGGMGSSVGRRRRRRLRPGEEGEIRRWRMRTDWRRIGWGCESRGGEIDMAGIGEVFSSALQAATAAAEQQRQQAEDEAR